MVVADFSFDIKQVRSSSTSSPSFLWSPAVERRLRNAATKNDFQTLIGLKEEFPKKLNLDRPYGNGSYRSTYLHEAVINGNYEFAKVLMYKYHCSPNVQDGCGKTPLHHSVIQKDPRLTKLLLDRGANPSIVDQEDKVPLHYAVMRSNSDHARLLLSCPNRNDHFNHASLNRSSPLTAAIVYGTLETLELLLSNTNVQLRVPGHQESLLSLAIDGYGQFLDLRLSLILRYIRQRLDERAIRAELGKGQYCSQPGVMRNHTPMHAAILNPRKKKEDRYKVIKIVAKSGCPTDVSNYFCKTPLHLAIEQKDVEAVHILLAVGCSATNTKLIEAALRLGSPEILELLFCAGGFRAKDLENLEVFKNDAEKMKIVLNAMAKGPFQLYHWARRNWWRSLDPVQKINYEKFRLEIPKSLFSYLELNEL